MGSPDTPVTDPPVDVVDIDPGSDEVGARSCAACPHPWSAHDALGRRFCTATREVGWARGCICR